MWPEWLETMDNFRSRRLDTVVYPSHRNLCKESEYFNYVTSPSPDTPSFELLLHVIEFRSSCFPSSRDVITAPEGTEKGATPFESAFVQLLGFVDEWEMQLDIDLAELVKNPSSLFFKDASGVQGVALGNATRVQSSQAPTSKLRLACAVFNTDEWARTGDVREAYTKKIGNDLLPAVTVDDIELGLVAHDEPYKVLARYKLGLVHTASIGRSHFLSPASFKTASDASSRPLPFALHSAFKCFADVLNLIASSPSPVILTNALPNSSARTPGALVLLPKIPMSRNSARLA